MEPSDFEYEGLQQQRAKAYDNFLRSNIDNEQDRRKFNTEPGRDHLPFRSFETSATDVGQTTIETKLSTSESGDHIKAELNKEFIVPLRWNNPHSSELEVNIWIMRPGQKKMPVVVPIRKPSCSGEGHQDNVFTFKIPSDFNTEVPKQVPGFTGCAKIGDCVMQYYAHSVESRTYAIGVPLIIEGSTGLKPTATQEPKDHDNDVGIDLDQLPRTTCLPSSDSSVHITNAKAQKARLVSDVFNHAYQNSDFSPYSGQQPKKISRNLQASAILKMVPGNRGELGKRVLNGAAARQAKKLDQKARNLVKLYESVANQVIDTVLEKSNKNKDEMGEADVQKTAECFRCSEVGAINSKRLRTNTYVPSFKVPQNLLGALTGALDESNPKVMDFIAKVHAKLVNTNTRDFLIYETVLDDMRYEFEKLGNDHELYYQPAAIKETTDTWVHPTKHRKIDADGKDDKGKYAATEAYKQLAASPPKFTSSTKTALNDIISEDGAVFLNDDQKDPNGVGKDSDCDDDSKLGDKAYATDPECHIDGERTPKASQLFSDVGQDAIPSYVGVNSASLVSASWLAGAVAFLFMCF